MPHPKTAAADHPILDVIRNRWSPRAFDARDVPPGDLLRLFEAARWAPSSRNEQPWRFVVVSKQRFPDPFGALLASLDDRNRAWAERAPVLVLVAVSQAADHDEARQRAAWYDAGQAVAFLALQATSMGLSIRQMLGFDRDRAGVACAVPGPFVPAIVMAIGHAGDPESLVIERHRQAETRPRTRRPLGELVFGGRWGEAYRRGLPGGGDRVFRRGQGRRG
jgi:nitroreductase